MVVVWFRDVVLLLSSRNPVGQVAMRFAFLDGLHRQRLYDAAMQRHAATRLVDLAGTFRSDEQLAHVLRSSALQVRATAATGTVAGVADDDDVMMTPAASQTEKSPVLAQESVISSWADIQRQETTGVVHHSTL